MPTKDFFWEIFQATGSIGAYLVYREWMGLELGKDEQNEFAGNRGYSPANQGFRGS